MTDKTTPGQWFVRTLVRDGEIVDCFVAAPDCTGLPYGAEIMGDDEYTRDPDLSRKLADCQLISAAKNLRDALEPFAQLSSSEEFIEIRVRTADVRAARAALDKADKVPS